MCTIYNDSQIYMRQITISNQVYDVQHFKIVCGRVPKNYLFIYCLYYKSNTLSNSVPILRVPLYNISQGSADKGYCEYVEKVDGIIDNYLEWNRLVSDDWELAFKISLKTLLNRLLSENKSSENRWRNFFRDALNRIFSFDRFIFTPSVGWTTSVPAELSLEFHGPGRNMTANGLNKFVNQEVIPIIEDQVKLVTNQSKKENIAAFLARVNIFSDRIMSRIWVM